jgi:hypothetical protein
MKQTAVEWLVEQLENHNGVTRVGFEKCIQEAKEMEKEQMCDFFREGYMWCNSPILRIEDGEIVTSTIKYGEFYYNKTFKNTKQ